MDLEVGVELEQAEREPRQRVGSAGDPAAVVAERLDLQGRVPHPPRDVRGWRLDRRHHPVGRRLGERLALDERDGVEAVGQLVSRAA